MFVIKQIAWIILVLLCSEIKESYTGWLQNTFVGWPVGDSNSLKVTVSLYYAHVRLKTVQASSINLCFWNEEDD